MPSCVYGGTEDRHTYNGQPLIIHSGELKSMLFFLQSFRKSILIKNLFVHMAFPVQIHVMIVSIFNRLIQQNLCKKATLKKDKKVFKMDYLLMQVESIAECSKGSILQYFRPSLSYQLSLRPLLCLSFSGRFTQVLLLQYLNSMKFSLQSFRKSILFNMYVLSTVQIHVMLISIFNRFIQ